jgi:hypothetical protein
MQHCSDDASRAKLPLRSDYHMQRYVLAYAWALTQKLEQLHHICNWQLLVNGVQSPHFI